MRRRALLMGGSKEPNTIIGNIGGTINTKALLATKLSISESIIRNFEVVGNDVHCRITSNYSIPNSAFLNNTEIISYFDFDNKVTYIGASAFQNSTIVNAQLENASIGPSSFWNSALTNEFFGYIYTSYHPDALSQNGSLRNTRIKHIVAPNIDKIGYYTLESCIELLTITSPPILYLNTGYSLSSCPKLESIDLSHVITIAANSISSTGIYELISDDCTSLGANNFQGTARIHTIKLNSAVSLSTGGSWFRNCSSLNLIELKSLKSWNKYTGGIDYAFQNLKTGCTIRINNHFATSDSGSPDSRLLFAKTVRSAVVEFYDDFGNYVSTL